MVITMTIDQYTKSKCFSCGVVLKEHEWVVDGKYHKECHPVAWVRERETQPRPSISPFEALRAQEGQHQFALNQPDSWTRGALQGLNSNQTRRYQRLNW